jgi:hypothetical protein
MASFGMPDRKVKVTQCYDLNLLGNPGIFSERKNRHRPASLTIS